MANLKSVNGELKKVVGRVKTAQSQLQALVKNQDWVDEARKYAERQGKEVRKILNGDVTKVRAFLEKEKKELEKFQKQVPGEVKKFREFVLGQRKELEKLLANVKKVASEGTVVKTASRAAGKATRSATKKVRSTKKKASTMVNAGIEPSQSTAPTAPESNPSTNGGTSAL